MTVEDAAAVAAELYNLGGTIKELGSQQDRNFRFDTGSGRFLLKFSNPHFTLEELDAQNQAMVCLAANGVAAPTPIPSLRGELLETFGADTTYLRLTSFVEGEPLSDTGYLAPTIVAELGQLCARSVLALSTLEHPGLIRTLQWDLKLADVVVAELAEHIADKKRRQQVEQAVAAAWKQIEPLRADLRECAIHGDLTDDNVVSGVGADGRLHPFGVIDLGDVVRSWLVAEIAITCSSVLHHNPSNPLSVLPAIREFHRRIPLNEAEARTIWPLIVARGAVLAASGEFQVAVDPSNEYAANNLPHEWVVFDVATAIPSAVATEAILLGLDLATTAPTLPKPKQALLPRGADRYAIVDLSASASGLNEGAWQQPGIEAELFAAASAKATFAVARYGEYRLTRAPENSAEEPQNFALHVEVALPRDEDVVSPAKAQVVAATKTSVVLRMRSYDLYVSGIRPTVAVGDDLKPGDPFAQPARNRGTRMTVQACTARDITPPLFTRARLAAAWQRICPDPSALFGVNLASDETDPSELLRRRNRVLPKVSHHYYEVPPQIARGWRAHLIDSRGRSYLDMCNNVSAIGHAHPKVADAANTQLRLLNTNSRFHYDAIVEYAERLASLTPEPLDTVLLVNSGTEAVDLALRMAQIHTGHRISVSHAEAYHGWSMAADGVSASTADNPAALTTRPDWVRFLPAPNWYRGAYPGFDSGAAYVADAAAAIATWSHNGGIASFISEPVFGNGGGIVMPDGYLAGIYEVVRAYGGLCIADEIQVGLGRLGHYFWGFEQQGVVPDIMTIAKPIGNGQPLGAVITRREIADSLSREGNVFSSAGGNPVSCRIGLAVLDALQEDRLVENAAQTGDYLRDRLIELSQRQPMIGTVHGSGFYLGVELVRDRVTLEPAAAEASEICDRLLGLGIIEQPTGDRGNVLKVKPPMCLSRDDADFYVEALDRVLTEGW